MSEKKHPSDPKSDKKATENAAQGDSSWTTEDMPTVTTLLNRRKLKLDSAPDVEPTPTSGSAAPKIRQAPRTLERRQSQRLELWTAEILQKVKSPEMRTVRLLLEEGIDWAVIFLKGERGAFEAKAVAGGSRERWAHWTGMRWSEASSPVIWRSFLQAEYLKFNAQDPSHASLLGVLGVLPGERAWAFKVGSRESPAAIILAGSRSADLAPIFAKQIAEGLR